MATYKEIQEYVRKEYNISIKTCWIADMKEKCGIPLRKAPNRKDSNKREYPCPIENEKIIKEAFKHFKLI